MALGHRFRTRSDTEVIVHAYEAWGPDAFARFNGQFAVALWDSVRKELVLARDRLGVRPLYLCEHGGRLWFASEVKAIFAGDPAIPRALDPVGLAETFTFWTVVPPQSVFRGRDRARAGPRPRRVARDGVRDRAVLDARATPRASEGAFRGSLAEAVERVRAALEEAVRLRMLRADVPVGSYLSGGLDSSLVAALGRRVKGERFCTFSLRFEDAEYDETPYQRMVAARIESDHREVVVSRQDIADRLPRGGAARRAPAPAHRPGAALPPLPAGARRRASRWCSPARAPTRCSPATTSSARARCGASGGGHPASHRPAAPAGAALPLPGPLAGGAAGDGAGVLRPRPRALGRARASPTAPAGGPPRRCSGSSSPRCARRPARLRRRRRGCWPRSRPSSRRWSFLAQDQYLEVRTLLSGYLLSSQGDRMLMAPLGGGALPLPRRRRGRAGQLAPRRLQAPGARREARAQAGRPRARPRRHPARAPSSPTARPDALSFVGPGAPAWIARGGRAGAPSPPPGSSTRGRWSGSGGSARAPEAESSSPTPTTWRWWASSPPASSTRAWCGPHRIEPRRRRSGRWWTAPPCRGRGRARNQGA